jgi:hypothetical protein
MAKTAETNGARRGLFTAEWFPYKHERFEASDKVALMSLAEEGAYHRAIRLAWKHRSLSADPAVLAAKIGKRCTVKIVEKVLTTFTPDPERPATHVIHPVVEEIRAEQEQKYLVKRKGGIHSRKKAEKRVSVSVGNKDTSSTTEMCSNTTPTRIRIENKNKEKSFPNGKDLKRLIAACVREHAAVDERLVEIAVRETLLRRKGSANENEPIKSAKYFVEEIVKLNATSGVGGKMPMGDKAIDAMLKRRREQTESE